MKILQLPSFLIHCLFLTSRGKQIKYSLQVDRPTKINDPSFVEIKNRNAFAPDPSFDGKVLKLVCDDKSQFLTNVITIISDIPIYLEPKKNMKWISIISE